MLLSDSFIARIKLTPDADKMVISLRSSITGNVTVNKDSKEKLVGEEKSEMAKREQKEKPGERARERERERAGEREREREKGEKDMRAISAQSLFSS